MGELHYRNYEDCTCEAPVKPVGVRSLTQQLQNDLMEISEMCRRIDLLINGSEPEDNRKKEGPSGLKEHLALNLQFTAEIKQLLYKILEALDG